MEIWQNLDKTQHSYYFPPPLYVGGKYNTDYDFPPPLYVGGK